MERYPIPPQPPPRSVDKKAEKEAKAFERGDYAELNRKHRIELTKVLHSIAMATMIILWITILLIGGIWILHLVTPWGWLDDKQTHQIQGLLFGALAAGSLKVLQRHIEKHQT